MLDIHASPDRAPKIYFTHSLLHAYIDPLNVSIKKQPFRTFNAQQFTHRLDLVLPAELWEAVRVALDKNDVLAAPHYARVNLSLAEILDDEFMEAYIRQGNVMMLSEGRAGEHNVFSLVGGVLKMELDRQTYEKCGLQGQPIEDGGKKHKKARWRVEYNLTLPCMKHGKKGFGRLEWAAKNVLTHSLTWLFHNFNTTSTEAMSEGREVLSRHAPRILAFASMVEKRENVLVPEMCVKNLPDLYVEDDALALLEWLQLLHLGAERLSANDKIDPHLSRYEVPDFGAGVRSRDFAQVSWKGFVPPVFARELFLLVRNVGFKGKGRGAAAGRQEDTYMEDAKLEADGQDTEMRDQQGNKEGEEWFAMSTQAFGGGEAWSVIQFAGRDTLIWEVAR